MEKILSGETQETRSDEELLQLYQKLSKQAQAYLQGEGNWERVLTLTVEPQSGLLVCDNPHCDYEACKQVRL